MVYENVYENLVELLNKFNVLSDVETLVSEFWHPRERRRANYIFSDNIVQPSWFVENIYGFDIKQLCDFVIKQKKNPRFLIGFLFNWSRQDLIPIDVMRQIQKEWHLKYLYGVDFYEKS
jgi:hypothetical protein